MGREIKFRAWARTGEWEEDGGDQEYEMNYDIAFEEFEPINDLLNGIEHLMQYSGLKAHNDTGADIYEGDLVMLYGYGIYQVEFPFTELYEAICENDIGAIVGNIHQNPDLLEHPE